MRKLRPKNFKEIKNSSGTVVETQYLWSYAQSPMSFWDVLPWKEATSGVADGVLSQQDPVINFKTKKKVIILHQQHILVAQDPDISSVVWDGIKIKTYFCHDPNFRR